jgi:hypothetical protein
MRLSAWYFSHYEYFIYCTSWDDKCDDDNDDDDDDDDYYYYYYYYDDNDVDECGAVGGLSIGRGNRSSRRKPSPVPRCPPQIPHYLTRNPHYIIISWRSLTLSPHILHQLTASSRNEYQN